MASDTDTFALTLNSAGDHLMSFDLVGGCGTDEGRSIAVAPAGTIAVTGAFAGIIEYDGVALASEDLGRTTDIFVVRVRP